MFLEFVGAGEGQQLFRRRHLSRVAKPTIDTTPTAFFSVLHPMAFLQPSKFTRAWDGCRVLLVTPSDVGAPLDWLWP